jgi:predicted PurR-regulated permease PerM
MTVTFFLLLLGFLIIGVRYFFVLSLIFAISDILPVIGVGAFLIPWGIFSLATGDFYRGMGLIILYAVITLTRQIAEPKILSKQMNIHPLITIFSMYVGLKILGIGGLIIAPFMAFLIKAIFNSIKKEKNIENQEKL